MILFLLLSSLAAAGPLDLPKGKFQASVELEREDEKGREYLVKFPSPVKSPFKPNDTVWAHFLTPPGKGPFPTVLVLPVMAAPNVWIEKQFIKRFRRDGLAVLWLEMPYQFHRRPHPSMPSGQVFLARRADRLAANFRQSALDARRALEFLRGRSEVDSARIGIFGISLGALVGSAVYSVDPAPRFASFMLGGADFPSLALASSMTGPFIKKIGVTPEALRAAWKGLDPVEYKENNASKPVLLINARWDAVIPRTSAEKLRDAFPAARQVWVPLGHYSALLHLIWVPRYVSSEMTRALTAPLEAAKKR